jgi:hypothetical protein
LEQRYRATPRRYASMHARIRSIVNSPAPTGEAPASDLDAIFRRLANG